MKKIFLLVFAVIYSFNSFGQKLDLIVTTNGDSIACKIDKIEADIIYFKTFQNKVRINTSIDRKTVADYNKGVINSSDISRIDGTIFFHTKSANPNNNLFINLLGDASLISINYERLFRISPKTFIAAKIGFGANERACIFCSSPPKYTTINQGLTINFYLDDRSYIELGLGGTVVPEDSYQNFIFYPIVGYRIHPLRSGKMNFRIYGSIPFTGFDTDIWFIPVGLSFGLSF